MDDPLRAKNVVWPGCTAMSQRPHVALSCDHEKIHNFRKCTTPVNGSVALIVLGLAGRCSAVLVRVSKPDAGPYHQNAHEISFLS